MNKHSKPKLLLRSTSNLQLVHPCRLRARSQAPAFLNPQNVRNPANVPTIPIDSYVFVLIVVIPPCPTNVWKNNAIADITTVGKLMIIAAIGVPIGCEHEPVTGTGMCQTDITNTAALPSPTVDMYAGSILRLAFIICLAPSKYENSCYQKPKDAPFRRAPANCNMHIIQLN